MAHLEGYRCPIVVRTTMVQPYDIPRCVGEIIHQLHEIALWTTRCASHVNHPAVAPPAKVPVATTLASEMELLKKSLTVVEKQQSNKLVTEIAYLQCALRSEADEKLTAFEHFVETRLGQCMHEHTLRLQAQQDELAAKMASVEAAMAAIRTDVTAMETRVANVEETLEANAATTSEMMLRAHNDCFAHAKQCNKAEVAIGNQLTQTRLQMQDAIANLKAQQWRYFRAITIAIRVELRDAVEHVRKSTQHHDKLLHRIARGAISFEGAKMTVCYLAQTETNTPVRAQLHQLSLKFLPHNGVQSPRGCPNPSYLMYANASLPGYNSPDRSSRPQEPPDTARDSSEVADDTGSIKELLLSLRKTAAPAEQPPVLETTTPPKVDVAPCYVLDTDGAPAISLSQQFSLQPNPGLRSGQGRSTSLVDAPAVGDRIQAKKDTPRGAVKRPRKPEVPRGRRSVVIIA
ncbi:hypothetical protein ACHHYP_07340 [Achlya hypogyna]|uniref:Uncharacterized protein n=1 Tax=Achlya hypogyna TaxID=1202772 RepID=A0A1V9ZMJ8_ACHHY|nr:hypothetical protein ACHHYP_07340 [Achlya hypogyna]